MTTCRLYPIHLFSKTGYCVYVYTDLIKIYSLQQNCEDQHLCLRFMTLRIDTVTNGCDRNIIQSSGVSH